MRSLQSVLSVKPVSDRNVNFSYILDAYLSFPMSLKYPFLIKMTDTDEASPMCLT